ncbi:ATPase, partial [Candidatus Woesearchaeota archaeon]|nr:ATPase [Candidatus Woesearchaeota archaeon]
MNHEKIVPDTSVIIEGLVTAKIESGELKPKEILIHEAVLAELEHQANEDKAIGFIGLEELKKLRKLCDARDITMRFSMIHILAYDEDATLVTADKIQARVAETKGIPLLFYKIAQQRRTLKLESYFDDTTMSAHLREKNWAFAKRGRPGAWTFDQVSKELLSRDDIQEISTEIIEEASTRDDGFIEIERPGSTIVQ